MSNRVRAERKVSVTEDSSSQDSSSEEGDKSDSSADENSPKQRYNKHKSQRHIVSPERNSSNSQIQSEKHSDRQKSDSASERNKKVSPGRKSETPKSKEKDRQLRRDAATSDEDSDNEDVSRPDKSNVRKRRKETTKDTSRASKHSSSSSSSSSSASSSSASSSSSSSDSDASPKHKKRRRSSAHSEENTDRESGEVRTSDEESERTQQKLKSGIPSVAEEREERLTPTPTDNKEERVTKSKERITKSKERITKSKERITKSKERITKSKERITKSKERTPRKLEERDSSDDVEAQRSSGKREEKHGTVSSSSQKRAGRTPNAEASPKPAKSNKKNVEDNRVSEEREKRSEKRKNEEETERRSSKERSKRAKGDNDSGDANHSKNYHTEKRRQDEDSESDDEKSDNESVTQDQHSDQEEKEERKVGEKEERKLGKKEEKEDSEESEDSDSSSEEDSDSSESDSEDEANSKRKSEINVVNSKDSGRRRNEEDKIDVKKRKEGRASEENGRYSDDDDSRSRHKNRDNDAEHERSSSRRSDDKNRSDRRDDRNNRRVDKGSDKKDERSDRRDEKSNRKDEKSNRRVEQGNDRRDEKNDKRDERRDERGSERTDEKNDRKDEKSNRRNEKSDRRDEKSDRRDEKSDRRDEKSDRRDETVSERGDERESGRRDEKRSDRRDERGNERRDERIGRRDDRQEECRMRNPDRGDDMRNRRGRESRMDDRDGGWPSRDRRNGEQYPDRNNDSEFPDSTRSKRKHMDSNEDKENDSRGPRPTDQGESEPVVKKTRKSANENLLTGKTGGAYIPPAKLRMMQAKITDKSSVEYQRISWEALKKSINGLINKVNVSNIILIVKELFQENIVRGRGLLARSVNQAQSLSPTFTHVYAALVAIINTKFPQNGELILRRLILQFKRGFKRNDKTVCLSASRFIAHLVNQQVAHEVIALELLTLLMENPTDDSVEVAVGFLKECGQKLSEVSPRGINAVFERLRNVLHEGQIETRVQYMVEVMFAIRKDGFKDHVSVIDDLDLVEESDQFTHLLTLEDAGQAEELLNVFRADPEFMENEEKYKSLKKEILDESSSDEDGDSRSASSSEAESDEEDEEAKQTIIDNTETNMIILRRTIYLTIQSSLDFEECAHKLLKMELKPGQEVELCNMILDCCAQLRTYEKFFGFLAQRFCQLDKKYVEPFQAMFIEQYQTIHRLETNKLRNVAKFFAHLLISDAINWGVLSCIQLNEEDTTSASRIFIKILFQELSEYLGLPKLNLRLKDPTLLQYFEGIMPRDNPKNTRFAINFFTTIGLGGLTDDLREHLKTMTKKLMQQQQEEAQEDADDDSSSSSSSSSDSDSDSSDSSSESPESSSEESEEEARKKKTSSKKANVRRERKHSSTEEKINKKNRGRKQDSQQQESRNYKDRNEDRFIQNERIPDSGYENSRDDARVHYRENERNRDHYEPNYDSQVNDRTGRRNENYNRHERGARDRPIEDGRDGFRSKERKPGYDRSDRENERDYARVNERNRNRRRH